MGQEFIYEKKAAEKCGLETGVAFHLEFHCSTQKYS